jgi:hypothetical protein
MSHSETYLLLGMYIDYGLFKNSEGQARVHKILKERWDNNQFLEAFEEYFKAWNVDERDFHLNEVIKHEPKPEKPIVAEEDVTTRAFNGFFGE